MEIKHARCISHYLCLVCFSPFIPTALRNTISLVLCVTKKKKRFTWEKHRARGNVNSRAAQNTKHIFFTN